ncbi:T9SS type A sorting domain-containing protein [bacterium]|nr:T9SS type A sorting domain-containing protein [bacterium]
MRVSTNARSVLSAALVLLLPSLAAAVAEVPAVSSLEFPLQFDTVRAPQRAHLLETGLNRSASIGSGWQVISNVHSDWIQTGYGGQFRLAETIRDDVDAESLSRSFLVANEELFGTRTDNIQLRNVNSWNGRYVSHYRQIVQGVPVWKADAFVLLGENGNVAAFGSTFFPEGDAQAFLAMTPTDAVGAAAAALNATPRTDRPIETERYWVPAPQGELMELTMAYRVVFESEEPFGKWESFVNAATGAILSRRNFFHTVNVVGSSEGNVQAEPPTWGWCSGSSTHTFAHQNISVSGGNSGVTDVNGDFDIAHGGSTPVNVTATFNGPYCNVNRYTGLGSDASVTQSFTPGTPGTFTWGNGNSRQDERDLFFNTNRSHDFMTAIDPGFTYLDYAMPSMVGRTDGFCPGNAWWDGTGINFCSAGSGYSNTAEIGNVVYHEYGHGVTQEVYVNNASSEPAGGLHEGNSDVLANFMDRNPVIGYGFFSGDCSGGIRNADNSLTYPAYNENGGHTDGQVIAGFHWEAWQSLLGAYPAATADAIAFDTWHFARDMGTPQTFPAQVLWTFMMDDDDANLGNGTPNYDHFCIAALSKGFTCPAITVGVTIAHEKLGHMEVGSGTTSPTVVATITSTEGGLNTSELKVHYRLNGGAYSEALMTATGGANEFSASLPAMDGNNAVDYYITAADLAANSAVSPLGAPANVYSFDVARTADDLETGATGWTAGLGGDTATTGQWGLFDPVGTAAQPEDDATVAPGVMCFITGQCGGNHGGCGAACDLGCNDIDGGTTTLLSPVYDVDGLENVVVKYERWYSNNTGAAAGEDFWVVDVSNNGGSTWTNVENTSASAATWTPISVDIDALFGAGAGDQVQLRFRASDLINGSLVEAGVDDLRILGDAEGGAVDAPAIGEGVVARVMSLEQAQPNPFAAATRIAFTLPSGGPVELAVYNVQGQMVRSLVSGVRESGVHRELWDGRDASGQAVSNGVYFYRLTAAGKSLTKKMTVVR